MLPLVNAIDWSGGRGKAEKAKRLLQEIQKDNPILNLDGTIEQLESLEPGGERMKTLKKLEDAIRILDDAKGGLPLEERVKLAEIKTRLREVRVGL